MSLRPYPEYKDSRQGWLGKIPSHWEVRPSKSVFGLRNEPERAGDDHLTPSQTLGVLPQAEYMRVTGNRVVLALAGTTMKHVEVNDFVIHLRSFQGGIEWSGFRGKVSPAYTVLYPYGGVSPAYFRHLLKSRGYVETIASLTNQLRDGQSMRYYDFGKTALPLPPVPEQHSIARFLDWETTEIDSFIADQEDLIGLLNERRAATITRAVTKGLDPHTPMKDSGFKWLGEVPKHWAVTQLKHAIEALPGYAFKSEEFTTDESDVRLLRGVNINPGRIVWNDVVRFDRNRRSEVREYELREGDLVLGLDRPIVSGGMRIASIRHEDLPALVLQRVARIRTTSRASQDYVRYLLESTVFADYLAPLFTGVSVPHMSPGQLGAFTVALPERAVQQAIAGHLDRETAEIDAAINDAQEAITLSKERREAVISAAVTGKIDVRDLVAIERAETTQGVPVGVA